MSKPSPSGQSLPALEAFYDAFPYPGNPIGSPGIPDVANGVGMLLPDQSLAGWRVLDAGCGTGQRLVALAMRYPMARFTGVDLSAASVAAADAAARAFGVRNLELRQGDLHEIADRPQRYDLIVCTGVVHHLPSPALAIERLGAALSDSGILYCWLYHALGEFDRLARRELALTLCDPREPDAVAAAIAEWDLSLTDSHYGNSPACNGDMDAFFHPCVNAYRFAGAIELFRGSDLAWVAINGINLEGESFLLDPSGAATPLEDVLALDIGGRIRSPLLRDAYDRQPTSEKLKVIELLTRPTGMSLAAGRRGALARVTERIRRASIVLDDASSQ